MIDFAHRQYFQARYYLTDFWQAGLLFSTFSLTAYWASVVAMILMWRFGNPLAWLPTLVALTLHTSWGYRGLYRVWLSQELFPEYRRQLRTTRFLDLLGGPVAALANWLLFATSAFGNRLVWREIHYVLDRQGYVLAVRHKEGRAVAMEHVREPADDAVNVTETDSKSVLQGE